MGPKEGPKPSQNPPLEWKNQFPLGHGVNVPMAKEFLPFRLTLRRPTPGFTRGAGNFRPKFWPGKAPRVIPRARAGGPKPGPGNPFRKPEIQIPPPGGPPGVPRFGIGSPQIGENGKGHPGFKPRNGFPRPGPPPGFQPEEFFRRTPEFPEKLRKRPFNGR